MCYDECATMSATFLSPFVMVPSVEWSGQGIVTPGQPWTQDGTATVAPSPPLSSLPRTLPLDYRPATPFMINRSDFPLGLVVIPTGTRLTASPEALPISASSGDQIEVTEDGYTEWPDGFVVWFD